MQAESIIFRNAVGSRRKDSTRCGNAISPSVVVHAARDSWQITMEIIGFIVIELIFSAIGWVCLSIWYRNRNKIEKIKDEKYAGQYSGAGRVFILNLIAGVGAITMFGIVIFFLVSWIYKSITN